MHLLRMKLRKKDYPTEHLAWYGMRKRCNDPSNKSYVNYGGRGIKVCPQWDCKQGFWDFLAHIGPKPCASLSLDRIDNERGYEPGNVRWATASQQNKNRRPFSEEWRRKVSKSHKRRMS
jgi:hypothetical protein